MDPGALRYWALVCGLAIVVAGTVGHAVASADRARARWGDTTDVWVTTEDVHAGDTWRSKAERQPWPTALVAPSMATALDADAEAAADVAAGMPIAEAQVLGADDADDDRRRTVAVPVAVSLPLRPGDRVDVWASAEETTEVASDALVVSVADDVVVVAVLAEEVGQLAAATNSATMVVSGRR